jgi:hypothetical protein
VYSIHIYIYILPALVLKTLHFPEAIHLCVSCHPYVNISLCSKKLQTVAIYILDTFRYKLFLHYYLDTPPARPNTVRDKLLVAYWETLSLSKLQSQMHGERGKI